MLQVRLDVDIRDTDNDRRDGVMQAAFAAAEAIAQRRRCGLRTETVFAYPAATSNEKVQQQLILCLCPAPQRRLHQSCQRQTPSTGSQALRLH